MPSTPEPPNSPTSDTVLHWSFDDWTEVMVTGAPCLTFCGLRVTPLRYPDPGPICPTCQTIKDQIDSLESKPSWNSNSTKLN